MSTRSRASRRSTSYTGKTWLAKVQAAGASESKIQTSIKRRREFDRDAGLSDQLSWLTDAGFAADCIYKHYFVAVFLALKQGP